MPSIEWNKFEWDDEDKKNGNVQHLRDHGIEPEEAEECFFHEYAFCRTNGGLTMFTFWMAEQIVADGCGWFFKTRAMG